MNYDMIKCIIIEEFAPDPNKIIQFEHNIYNTCIVNNHEHNLIYIYILLSNKHFPIWYYYNNL